MAGTDAQKQLLALIRDFASEKSQGERRVAGLRKQIEELRSALDAANAELEDTKIRRETAEQELKGYEVELAVNESAIQALEARISATQKEASTVRSDLQDLKIQQELLDLEMKVLLMEAIAKATRDLQDLTRYPSLKVDHALSSRQHVI
ncbi:hypothetical protein EUGRSUZ_J02159 [Eucalyptus grandis]|uniref:Uncharacterized protein n=2 Tax=Eucalyptus grandis TaxID=71139 RepID=A0ACC3J8D2_EUCGR|nr:hypothetical protein EUGRSUZ_J02159 [Eucalyptus grandis]